MVGWSLVCCCLCEWNYTDTWPIITIIIIITNIIVINFDRNGSTFDQHILRSCHKHGRRKLQGTDVSSYRHFYYTYHLEP